MAVEVKKKSVDGYSTRGGKWVKEWRSTGRYSRLVEQGMGVGPTEVCHIHMGGGERVWLDSWQFFGMMDTTAISFVKVRFGSNRLKECCNYSKSVAIAIGHKCKSSPTLYVVYSTPLFLSLFKFLVLSFGVSREKKKSTPFSVHSPFHSLHSRSALWHVTLLRFPPL